MAEDQTETALPRAVSVTLLLVVSLISVPATVAATAQSASNVDGMADDQSVDAPPYQRELEAKAQASGAAGDFVQARVLWEHLATTYADTGNVEGQADALRRSGESSLALGELPRALISLTRAWEIAEAGAGPPVKATIANSLGYAYGLSGQRDRGQALLESSASVAERLGDSALLAAATNNLGNLLAGEGRLSQAAMEYRRAINAAAGAGDESLSARASANLARVYLDLGEDEQAKRLLGEASERLEARPWSHQKAYTLISLGRLQARLTVNQGAIGHDAARRAQALFSEAAAIADQLGDLRGQSYAYGYMGELYEQARRYEEALELTQRAAFAAQRVDAADALYRWYWQSGRILVAQGDTEAAISAYRQAVYTLESIRQDLNADLRSSGLSFRESVGPVYFELADLLLRRASLERDQQQADLDRIAARDTVELVKGAELEDYFQDDCVAAFKARSAGIEGVGERTAVIYPIVLEDRTELLLTLPDGLKQFRADVEEDSLTAEVRELRHKLEKRTTHEYYPHARQVYEWLIRPLQAELARQRIDTLVVVPDGPLRTIPFAVLHDGESFLIDRYALATTPGLTLTDPTPLARSRIEVLASGLTDAVQGFSALPHVDTELRTIQELYDPTVVLENEDFVLPKVEREVTGEPFSIVHIASHGQFSSDVDDTFLLTYDAKIGMDTLEQIVSRTRFREEGIELLTLSACETATGDDRAALGLAGVAVKAGARSALATLWTVNDPAAAALVVEFYRRLKDPGVSKGRALREAQLSLADERRYWHPSYWSPFLLIGNWL